MNIRNFCNALKHITKTLAVIMLGITAIIFFTLYLCEFCEGTFYILSCAFLLIVTLFSVIILLFKEEKTLYFSAITVAVFITVASVLLYLLKSVGIVQRLKDVESLREYVSSFKGGAVIPFIIIQFLQVVVLPLPSIVTISAGVLLFGALKSALFSFIGIISGSLTAFYIGRFLGVRAVKRLIGEKTLDKTLNGLKGKDKTALTLMFVFPFFPDDLLCFIAGLSSMSSGYFISVILITRALSVFTTAYSVNNSLIPYTTWWGIIIWGIIITAVISFTVYFSKKGKKFGFIKGFKK